MAWQLQQLQLAKLHLFKVYMHIRYASVYVVYSMCSYRSRHTVVCREAQEAGTPHREYINRKKETGNFRTFVAP